MNHARIELTDSDLIDRCLQRDKDAWELLVVRYERLVYSIPHRYGLNASEVDDVFQTTWLALLKNLESIEEPNKVGAWLAMTAKRACWDKRRGTDFERSRSADPDTLTETQASNELAPEVLVEQFEQNERVRLAFEKLAERCKRLIHMLYYAPKKHSYAEIATALDVPQGAIGPNRARCLKQMREHLHLQEQPAT